MIEGIEYGIDWNSPPQWDAVYPFSLDIDVCLRGVCRIGEIEKSFNKRFEKTFDLGEFSLEDALGGASKEDVISFLIGLPKAGYYLAPGSNLHDGRLYFALAENPVVRMEDFGLHKAGFGLPAIDRCAVTFDGDIKLTATPIPSTVFLFASGLFGLVGIRKRFRK